MSSVTLCVLAVAMRSLFDISLLPLMFIPIIPDVGSDGLYANNISPLFIPILCRGPWRGGDNTCG